MEIDDESINRESEKNSFPQEVILYFFISSISSFEKEF